MSDYLFFFFNITSTTEIYTLSLHDALPICEQSDLLVLVAEHRVHFRGEDRASVCDDHDASFRAGLDRKSTRLNSSHVKISYAVFCLKKKKIVVKVIMES